MNINILNFQAANELFDKFVECNNQKIKECQKHSFQWKMIDKLCDYMNNHQQQSLSITQNLDSDCSEAERRMTNYIFYNFLVVS